jgi:hypothetical protein
MNTTVNVRSARRYTGVPDVLVLRIKQMIHRRLARYRTYRPRPRSDRLDHLIASEH